MWSGLIWITIGTSGDPPVCSSSGFNNDNNINNNDNNNTYKSHIYLFLCAYSRALKTNYKISTSEEEKLTRTQTKTKAKGSNLCHSDNITNSVSTIAASHAATFPYNL
jgi:hypothetical protein